MVRLLTRLLIFLVPVGGYFFTTVYIDPYNYFRAGVPGRANDLKKEISYKLNDPLYKLIEFEKKPAPYILLGSSQTGLLTSDEIQRYTGHEFYNMSFGGGTLPEVISAFWELNSRARLKEVYIGISFIDFNGSQYRNRLTEVIDVKSNIYTYSFSNPVIRATAYIIYGMLSGHKFNIGKPEMSEDEFWKFQLDNTANRYLTGHSYPGAYYDSLVKISEYCGRNDIKLVFFIPANHIDLQHKIQEFHLEAEYEKFKDDLARLGKVYDFDYENSFTKDRSNFSDPFHVTHEASKFVVRDLFMPDDSISVSRTVRGAELPMGR